MMTLAAGLGMWVAGLVVGIAVGIVVSELVAQRNARSLDR